MYYKEFGQPPLPPLLPPPPRGILKPMPSIPLSSFSFPAFGAPSSSSSSFSFPALHAPSSSSLPPPLPPPPMLKTYSEPSPVRRVTIHYLEINIFHY